jgi:hypothetical protein
MKLIPGHGKISPSAEGSKAMPLPGDAPLLTFAEAGAYLRLTAESIRKLVDGRADAKDDELGSRLRAWVVRLSPHRRYILREPFFRWLQSLGEDVQARAG